MDFDQDARLISKPAVNQAAMGNANFLKLNLKQSFLKFIPLENKLKVFRVAVKLLDGSKLEIQMKFF